MNPIDFLFATGLEIAKSMSETYEDYDDEDYEKESFSDKAKRHGVCGAAKFHDQLMDEYNKRE